VITNATITNITTAPVADATGKRTFGSGTTVSVRCFAESPTRNQQLSTDARVSQASLVLYVPIDVPVSEGGRVTVTMDEVATVVYEVTRTIGRSKDGGLSHLEVYLKAV
jgi:hypothetical protein